MTSKQLGGVQKRLDDFLEKLLEPMGRKERRHWAQLYIRGLLLEGQRKSVQPMAGRLAGGDEQGMNQFLNQSPWEVGEIQQRLAAELAESGASPVYWVVDETSFPKAGAHSVGVARQYCGALGKLANCQVAVSLHWSEAELSFPVGWRLLLPEEWIKDKARRAAAHIPPEVGHRTKTDLALDLIAQAQEWAVPEGEVLADCAYGNRCEFREQLRARNLRYTVAVEARTVVWQESPHAPTQRRRCLPARFSLGEVAAQVAPHAWRTVTWRVGTKGPQTSRFALVQVWATRAFRRSQVPPRPAEWLLIEWPAAAPAPTDYWLHWNPATPAAPALRRAVHAAHGRWKIEQDYRELKEELGLDHFEGRGWVGWHHHVTLVSLAFAFLRHEQLRAKKNFWCDLAPPPLEPPARPDPPPRPLPLVPSPLPYTS